MAKAKTEKTEAPSAENPTPTPQSIEIKILADALAQAIGQTKPVEKKTAINRKVKTPWTPKDGSPKLKLKRAFHQHGIPVDPDMSTNLEIDLMNKVRPGVFMEGHVKVIRRKDRGMDITYPVKTAAQRLQLVNRFGIRNFAELLQRCIDEAENPSQYEVKDDA